MSPEYKPKNPEEFRVVSSVLRDAQPLNGVEYSPKDIRARMRMAAEDYNVHLAPGRIRRLSAKIADQLNHAPRPAVTVENDLFDTE